MFRSKKHNYNKRKTLLFKALRLLLSLTMFLILGLLAFQAANYFSGGENQNIEKILSDLRQNPNTAILEPVTSLAGFINLKLSQNKNMQEFFSSKKTPDQNQTNTGSAGQSKTIFKFALVADSHNNNEGLSKALSLAKTKGVKFVIGLGDYTDIGTKVELEEVKTVFESADLPYYLTAGDHDLWDSRDKNFVATATFNQVFGTPYQSFSDSNIRFIIIFNSDNYEGVDEVQMQWLKDLADEIENNPPKLVFAFLHEPLFHPTSDRVMGLPRSDEGAGDQKGVAKQCQELMRILKGTGTAQIFTGHVHAYFQYEEPGSDLKMTTIGALTVERNTQAPRFSIVDVFDDGSYNVEDLEIK